MEFKDTEKLSNNDLKLYKINLEAEFEKVKGEIKEKMELLDTLDKEYMKADKELNKRNGNVY